MAIGTLTTLLLFAKQDVLLLLKCRLYASHAT
jgi:hypothetical protein